MEQCLWTDCDVWSDQVLMVLSVHPNSHQFLRRIARHHRHSTAFSLVIASSTFLALYSSLKSPHLPSLWSWAVSCSSWSSRWMEFAHSLNSDHCTRTVLAWSSWAEVWFYCSFASLPSGLEFLAQLRSHSWKDQRLVYSLFNSQSAHQHRNSPHSSSAFSFAWVFAQTFSHPFVFETDSHRLAMVCKGR